MPETRMARCSMGCGSTYPSSKARVTQAFFEDRGPGSKYAQETCRCGFYKSAHDKKKENNDPHLVTVCDNFTPGPKDYDLFYCGCRGWD